MSAYPVKEQLVQAIAAALEQISTANGYATDGVEVIRPRRTGEGAACRDKLIRVIQGNDDPSPDDNLCGNPPAVAWKLTVQIDAIIRLSEKSALPMDQVLNLFEADIRKALMIDCQFGGLALRSELGETRYPDGENGLEGMTVWFYTVYRVAENDPFLNMA